MNPYTSYYIEQVGSGISGFSGIRYQRGGGFFGRAFSGIGSFLKNLLPSVGKRLLPTGIGLAQDILAGENVAKSAKSRLIEAGRNVADETLEQIKSKIQKGSGIRRRGRRKRKQRFEIDNKKIKRVKRRKSKKRRKVNKKPSNNRFPNFLR